MQKLLLGILLLFCIVSCKSKEEKLKEQMLPLITDIMLKDSVVNKIDSLIIYDIDTLTQLDIESWQADWDSENAQAYQSVSDSYLNSAKIDQSQMQSNSSQMKLYAELGWSTLMEHERTEGLEHAEDIKKNVAKAKLYTDTSMMYSKKLEDFVNRREAHKIDSITFKGYIAKFRIKGADANNKEVKRDSLHVYFSDNLRIITPQK